MAQQGAGQTTVVRAQIQAASFSGPLPPPEILARFDEVVPGAAARIIDMAQKQSDHRMDLEKTTVHGELTRSYLGLGSGTIVSLAMIAGGVYCVMNGHDTAGATIVTANLAAVVGVFVYGTRSRRKEREGKAHVQASMLARK
jgi:uncharacterized membrane protein